MDGEAPRAWQPLRAQRRANALHQSAALELAPSEEPAIKIAAEIGDVPGGDISTERRCSGVSDRDQDQPADRRRGALPADLVEAVERAEYPGGRRRTHSRQ